MREQLFSRRAILAAAGISTAALLAKCDATAPPKASPFLNGPYQTAKFIMGEDAGTVGLLQSFRVADLPIPIDEYAATCVNGVTTPIKDVPERVLATVHYPSNKDDHRVTGPNPMNVSKGPFPVLLYAHGVRDQELACQTPFAIDRDFTRVDFVLQHLAAYGCVAIAPDLSWLPGDLPVWCRCSRHSTYVRAFSSSISNIWSRSTKHSSPINWT